MSYEVSDKTALLGMLGSMALGLALGILFNETIWKWMILGG